MSKYNQFERNAGAKKPGEEVHPIWRGIGCVMMVLIPVLSVIGALVIIETGKEQKWPLPAELLGTPQFPYLMYTLPVVRDFTATVSKVDDLFAIGLISVVLMILGFFVLSFLYSLAYKIVGPPRYTRLDAPDVPRGKRYKR